MAMTNFMKRVEKELEEYCSGIGDDISGIRIKPKDETLSHLIGTIPGPMDTPYETGLFDIDINLLDEYPLKPPHMKFITNIWHPNINSQTGAMCLDTLNREWNPTLTLKAELLSVQALLSAPRPDVPQDTFVANQYIEDYETFVATARYWTATFAAKPPNHRIIDKVEKLTELGFSKASVEEALESVDDDEILALHKLASGPRPRKVRNASTTILDQ